MDPIQLLAQHLAAQSSLKQDQINLICSHFRVEKVRPEVRIASQGRPYGKLVFVADGILRVFVVTPDGDEVVKNFVEQNGFFADLECTEKDRPAVLNLSAVTHCTLLTLSKMDSARLVKLFPNWEHMMREGAMRAMNEMIRKQEFLRIGTSAEQYRHLVENFPNLIQHVSLKHIASYLRITQSSLSRIRKQGW
ncbi:MAG TPA: Crp/Fnr family transcriptional regulator [Polyangia bacterium]